MADNEYQKAYTAMKSEWVGVLAKLWRAIGVPIDKARLDLYVDELKGIPLALLEHVVSKLLAGNTYHSIPTIGEIWKEIHLAIDNTGGNTDAENMDDWVWENLASRRKVGMAQ